MSSKQISDEQTSNKIKKLVLIGNGFDLAHGLKTNYRNFIDWYMCKALERFCANNFYDDPLIEIKHKYVGSTTTFNQRVKTFEDVLNFISSSEHQYIKY